MNQPYQPVPPTTRSSVTAIISLISGIAGFSVVPFLGSVVAVITGHMAKSEIKKNNGLVTGNGMATAGLILGYLGLATGLCLLCVFVVLPLLGIFSVPFIGNTGF